MFDFIKENILEDLKRSFIFNKRVHLYETGCFIFQKGFQNGLDTLSYDGVKLWWY